MNPVAKIRSLTSLRFVAAAMVLLHHLVTYLPLKLGPLEGFPLGHGVSFFFVLSGFILAYVYPDLSASGAKTEFWLARFARLWPLHAFCAILFLLQHGVDGATVSATLLNLSLLHAWIPRESLYTSLNDVSWSISVEVFFYLCFPILIANWERDWLRKLAFAGVVVVSLVRTADALHLPGYAPHYDGLTTHGLIYINPAARLFEFVLGMSASRAWRWMQGRPAPGAWISTGIELLVLGVTLGAMTIGWHGLLSLARPIGRATEEWAGQCSSCFAFALLIPIFALERGWISRLLGSWFFVLFGELSYSIYLTHKIVFNAFLVRFPAIFAVTSQRAAWASAALLCSSVLVVSYITWRFIETPARRKLLARQLVYSG